MESYKKYTSAIQIIRPTLSRYVHIILVAITTLIFKPRQVCITIWMVGPSSSGKGEILKLTTQLPDEAKELQTSLFHRSDKFTENCFVSNRADVKTEEARTKLDLLRKLPDKVLVTAELGSFVSGNKEKLTEKFGILTRVLDGEGLATDTGAHGHRSVDEKVEFVWIGGVTELTPNKLEALSQIGGRVLTLAVDVDETDEEKLTLDIINGFPEDGTAETSKLLSEFYDELFRTFPKGTIKPDSIQISATIGDCLAKLSTLGALLRSNVTSTKEEDNERSTKASKEKPFRFAKNLHLLARASAILDGRAFVNHRDIAETVLPIVLSSGPEARHRVFSFLAESDDEVSVKELGQRLDFGKTALYTALRELKALGLLENPDSIAYGHETNGRFKAAKEYRLLIQYIKKGFKAVHSPSPINLRTVNPEPFRKIEDERGVL